MAEPMEISTGFSDALTILGAAGIVIPAFARIRISPVIGFILVGMIVGPYALGAMADERPWLQAFSITDPEGDQAVRRPRHRPPAVRDRARIERQAPDFDAQDGVRDRRGGASDVGAADRRRVVGRGHRAGKRGCAGDRAGDVVDRAGAADRRHQQPGRARGLLHAAVRGSGAGALAVRARRGRAGAALAGGRDHGHCGGRGDVDRRADRPSASCSPRPHGPRAPSCSCRSACWW